MKKYGYIYQGDTTYAIFCDNKFLFYVDLDNFGIDTDEIDTEFDEINAIKKVISYYEMNNCVLSKLTPEEVSDEI